MFASNISKAPKWLVPLEKANEKYGAQPKYPKPNQLKKRHKAKLSFPEDDARRWDNVHNNDKNS